MPLLHIPVSIAGHGGWVFQLLSEHLKKMIGGQGSDQWDADGWWLIFCNGLLSLQSFDVEMLDFLGAHRSTEYA